jgi:hypothetical protein
MLRIFEKCLRATKYLALVTLATGGCLGQSRPGDLITNIPFPFVVANHTLPPGRYTVTPISESNIRIYAGNEQGVLIQTHSVEGRTTEGIAKVVFHRYGAAYFLSQVWIAANGIGRELPTSPAERELGKRGDEETAVVRASSQGRSFNQNSAQSR